MLPEFAEIAVLGFVIAGPLNAVVNTRAVAQYLGGVLVFDTRRGTIIHTTLINQGPQAVAVDDQTGQSVVVCQPADPHTGSPRGPARLTLLDGASGRPVHSVILPPMGGAISIGIEQHQIVLLGDIGDDMRAPYHSRLLQVDVRSARVVRAVSVPPQGRVGVLDAATGTLVRTLAFRAMLGLLLVDTHAHAHWSEAAVCRHEAPRRRDRPC
jgi:hypothetical protein